MIAKLIANQSEGLGVRKNQLLLHIRSKWARNAELA